MPGSMRGLINQRRDVVQASDVSDRRELAFEQHRNHYVPHPYYSARLLLDHEQQQQQQQRRTTRGVEINASAAHGMPIEVEANPVYLQTVMEDANFTRAGQPFHPVFPGSTRQLRQERQTLDRQRFLSQQPIDEVVAATKNRTRSSPVGATGANASRALAASQQQRHVPFLANPAFNAPIGTLRAADPFRPSEGSFAYGMTDPVTGKDRNLSSSLYEAQLMSYVNMRQHEAEFLGAGGDPRELGLIDPSRTIHQQHTVRSACSDAVDLVRSLLFFRNVDTLAKRGPHREVFNRFMDIDFLQDLQWLLKSGLYLIKYPNTGVGGAVHYRHFTVWNLPWSPDKNTPPRMAPFLVWRNDNKASSSNGRVPLCNFLGATRDVNDSKVFQRYANRDGISIKGPIYDNLKRTEIPVANIASLWFLCQVTGTDNPDGTVTSDLADVHPLEAEQQQQLQQATVPTPGAANRTNDGPDVEQLIARGLMAPSASGRFPGGGQAPPADLRQQQQQQQQQQAPQPAYRFERGTLGRINVDVACRDRPSLERFLRVMDGIAAINEVTVQQWHAGGRSQQWR